MVLLFGQRCDYDINHFCSIKIRHSCVLCSMRFVPLYWGTQKCLIVFRDDLVHVGIANRLRHVTSHESQHSSVRGDDFGMWGWQGCGHALWWLWTFIGKQYYLWLLPAAAACTWTQSFCRTFTRGKHALIWNVILKLQYFKYWMWCSNWKEKRILIYAFRENELHFSMESSRLWKVSVV